MGDEVREFEEVVTTTTELSSLPPVGLYINVDVNDLLDRDWRDVDIFEFLGKLKDLFNA